MSTDKVDDGLPERIAKRIAPFIVLGGLNEVALANEIRDELGRTDRATPQPSEDVGARAERAREKIWQMNDDDMPVAEWATRVDDIIAAEFAGLSATPDTHQSVGLSLFRQLVKGRNALRDLDVFWCNVAEHGAGCKCFWEQCERWAAADCVTATPDTDTDAREKVRKLAALGAKRVVEHAIQHGGILASPQILDSKNRWLIDEIELEIRRVVFAAESSLPAPPKGQQQ